MKAGTAQQFPFECLQSAAVVARMHCHRNGCASASIEAANASVMQAQLLMAQHCYLSGKLHVQC